jgi:hypothetical protein
METTKARKVCKIDPPPASSARTCLGLEGWGAGDGALLRKWRAGLFGGVQRPINESQT